MSERELYWAAAEAAAKGADLKACEKTERERTKAAQEKPFLKRIAAQEAENAKLRAIIVTDQLLERLAHLEHERWAQWMIWMFDNWTVQNVRRWKMQMVTSYSALSEREKESDRKEARNTLAVFRKAAEAAK